MNFSLLGAGACCATFAATTALAACIAWAAPSSGRPFRRRVLPSVAGLVAALGMALPAFLLFEPRGMPETPGGAFIGLALLGAAWAALGCYRAARDVLIACRLSRQLSSHGQLLSLAGAPAPAYRIRHDFPLVTLVGIVRPRLFIASQVLDCLTGPELDAVLAHEAAHARARDNLSRLLVRAAPALPWRSAAERLEREWERAVEERCDDRAASGIDLASALVKVARLAERLAAHEAALELPAASLYRGGPLTRRVARLLAADRRAVPGQEESGPRAWLPIGAAALAAAVLLPASWSVAHRLLERLVHLF